ncbi:MAG: hypothetical protein A3B74_00695 [Candidatus Kerfeldbacteria bacterium RIFCSPHIGHO2_02_FULL_42_14]|uniref:Uncharacterized protein n=1 Tax=Candidatus Kerfeldbacteria bacterium RIFCSPHIGHO2_02_FULL_42_14 TaxID=1798540 RepID=A0A1G2AR13_9BACT|nr:MAG: hypothetical protein A3B74_00695 [Candidatus Kerfeldbacteria bacterium RIFCSPHIGHO2_02_FULL_42_14]OGY81875.1 MAG: hypothetical protein A3E60_00775 [Candidatus Kerfeldbacteria bacterium RIFCSPHIGHO2_12_FULL_42_13]OGY83490.1 MAG: hypothetical protein A3I91_02480 [Candidatus Kerfeldbacteria bacterium RIFCSPLOWO2_02_FULL_42_19]OGY86984.1 MAG: hypothetical protein A3G01_01730 [Candidatus Kerfeldbacteria bacterium RIFCSPLOWO2_12_FULL_43_9]
MDKRSQKISKNFTSKDYVGIIIALLIVVLALLGRWYFQKEGRVTQDKTTSGAASENSSNSVNDADTPASRLFFLRPTQVSFDEQLDIRVILSELVFIPCPTSELGCRFQEFRAGIIVSVVSEPQNTTRLLFNNFPSEQFAFGKRFRLLDAAQDFVRLLVVESTSTESATIDTGTSQNFVITVDDAEVVDSPQK